MPRLFVNGKPVPEALTTVEAKVGQVVTILAEELAPAGYIWQLMPLDEGVKKVAEDTYPLHPGVGGPDLRVIVLLLEAPGPHVINMEYGRPWEGMKPWTVVINVLAPIAAGVK